MKELIRKKVLEQRKLINNKVQKDLNIINNLKSLLTDYQKIMIYYPIYNEPNILSIINDKTKEFYLPYCKNNEIEIRKIYDLNDLILDEEKVLSSKHKTNDIIDIVIAPALSTNSKCYRLGYGKGYYDRFLQKHNIKKIIVVYDEFIIEEDFQDEWDISFDYIVTDKKIIKRIDENV